jgi:short-subunit dehydrogenase
MKLDRGRVAIVTGASRGIGRAITLALAARGVRVVALARSRDALAAVTAEAQRSAPESTFAVCDVADPADVVAAVRNTVERFGRIDLVVNNAGFGSYAPFLAADLEEFHALMRVNYFGSLHVTRAVLPTLLEQRSGHLVFIASIAGRIASPRHTGYAATKFAIVGLAESLAYELEPYGIGITTVNPGTVATDFFERESFKDFPEGPRRMMIPAEAVARAMVRAVERNRAEVFVPGSLRFPYVLKALLPRLFRAGVMRYARSQGMIPAQPIMVAPPEPPARPAEQRPL